MSMPQRSVDTTVSAETLAGLEKALRQAFSFHEALLQETHDWDDFSMAMRRRSEVAQTEIEAALSRIREGSIGRCERCRTMIDSDRLETMPHTRYCRNCAT